MIIVKTKNGDRFINDKAVTMVEHDKEKAVVTAYRDDGASYNIKAGGGWGAMDYDIYCKKKED